MEDKVAKGRQSRGETGNTARLTVQQVKEIRASTEHGADLARRYSVASGTITDIRTHTTWAHIDAFTAKAPLNRGETCKRAKLTEVQVISILADPRNYETIAADYGVSGKNIGHIKNRRSWKHLRGHN